MQVIISKHAIKQYRKKMFDFNMPLNEVLDILTTVVIKGTRVRSRPSIKFPIYEVKYRGLSVTAEFAGNTITVITFLGDNKYQRWCRKKEIAVRYA